MQYILTDIEGTTTSIDFVYKTLFPYFLENVHTFSETAAADPAWIDNINSVRATVKEEQLVDITPAEAVQKLIEWTVADRKHTALKNIQGMVWKQGYETGEIKSHIYEEVPAAFEAWQNAGIGVGIYSSGSVAAQKLLFRFSAFGDLSPYISGYFDTTSGNKRDPEAYRNIAGQLALDPAQILFLSDIEAELDAANTAGFGTCQVVRAGTTPGSRHRHIADFTELIHSNK